MANDNSLEPPYDCIIIGGGPAGIYAYRVLARQRYRVIVLDAGLYQHNLSSDTSYRTNRRSDPILSYLDHLNNNAFVPSSEIQVEAATISSTKALQNGHYEASDTAGRTWRGRTLLLAVGMRTVFPDLPGYQDCWNGTM
jgi:thioredoxin reductase